MGKADAGTLKSYFEVEMPPVFGVMTALLLSFVIGIGLSLVPRGVLRKASIEFRAIISDRPMPITKDSQQRRHDPKDRGHFHFKI